MQKQIIENQQQAGKNSFLLDSAEEYAKQIEILNDENNLLEILNNYISVTFVYTDNNNPFDSIGKLVERSIDEIREKQTKLVHEANSRLLKFESDVAESEKEKIKFISKLQEELREEQNLFFEASFKKMTDLIKAQLKLDGAQIKAGMGHIVECNEILTSTTLI